jgi:predicted RNA-binding protein with PUA domain
MKTLLSASFVIFSLFSPISKMHAAENGSWYEGVVVLEDKKVIIGTVSINEKYHVVVIKQNDKMKSIPAWQIRKVTIHDREIESLRNFIVLPSGNRSGTTYSFYEIIVDGEIMLLARDKIYKNRPEMNGAVGLIGPETLNQFANNKDYLLYDGKNLMPLEKFRRKALPAFKKYFEEEIDLYMREQKLNINFPKDQIRLVKYFNKLYNDKLILVKG